MYWKHILQLICVKFYKFVAKAITILEIIIQKYSNFNDVIVNSLSQVNYKVVL